MTAANQPDVWLRGPVAGIAPQLQPAAHAILQSREDLERVTVGLSDELVWRRAGAAAPAGFHIKHAAGALDRLFTYARGEALSTAQKEAMASESAAGESIAALREQALATFDRALDQLRGTPAGTLGETRTIGRAALPTTVLGLLFHAAEHSARHVGQLITTLKVVTHTHVP